MGAWFSQVWYSWFLPNREYKVCMVGLDNAGKTTTLYKLSLGEVIVTQPTVGSNVESVKYKNIKFEVWDLGGQANLRPYWSAYFQNTDAVIIVIDSTDRARIGIVKSELFSLLKNHDLSKAAVLIFANKQDLKDAMSPTELSENLTLTSIKDHPWHIQACCALTGSGLMEGLGWLAERVRIKYGLQQDE
eukprot:TRINITY_DN37964_c0_g1_i1.p3 TRINITY_DN37964_c0_g1~~TRINITY_DN37964_c0_g1_i1.p3  ORF type:complete len:189 (-),score=9.20 TRINITY_DN37964_c0_g1_i1:633-1199(-)